MKSKVCKHCKIFVEGGQCPLCKGTNFSSSIKGRIIVIDPVNSEIAKKMGITAKGEYAIKVA
jgi:DNA-directed RNA polymerase subunit E"